MDSHNIKTARFAYFTISYFGQFRQGKLAKITLVMFDVIQIQKGYNIAKEGFELALGYDNVFSCNFYSPLETQTIFTFQDPFLRFYKE